MHKPKQDLEMSENLMAIWEYGEKHPEFRQRFIDNPMKAANELGYPLTNAEATMLKQSTGSQSEALGERTSKSRFMLAAFADWIDEAKGALDK
jgi:hypothetical protein